MLDNRFDIYLPALKNILAYQLMGSHFHLYNNNAIFIANVYKILATSNSQRQLLIKELLFINGLKASLNTKDEYRSHTLFIKL